MNPERIIKKSAKASAPVSAYKFNSEHVTWEDCQRAKARLSVPASYYVDYKYSIAHEGAVVIREGNELRFKDSVLAAQLKGKRIVLIASLEPQIRALMNHPKLQGMSRLNFTKMLDTALHEAVRLDVCDNCRGSGEEIEESGKIVECHKCKGTGRTVMRPANLSKMCGVDAKSWNRDHLPKYELFRSLFVELQKEFEFNLDK